MSRFQYLSTNAVKTKNSGISTNKENTDITALNADILLLPDESPILDIDANMVVPVIYEDLVNGINNPERLTRLFGITLQ
ncbi:MAG: hypothetical protein LBB59_01050 [Campylobacteraceae bacterium]|nr:hypothetical protein [Campylobacteraceae bacterium]